ncbi:dde superfamily endonuclease [Holotrichia oblita]|uniref:Dde superfamily endonuclease n=1 Tax=Holotrichia oblita TaxID=644536 RepID=A0ACB9SNK0_HOLOL|nr:dde superfamily endonuclease [Holotrichia oblita]
MFEDYEEYMDYLDYVEEQLQRERIPKKVISGPKRQIMDIVVRHPGSSHDSVIFDRNALRVRMERSDIPGVLLGDNGYACRNYLLTPVLHPATQEEVRYNTAQTRTRNIVEGLFGTWKKRFPCLQ